MGEVLARREIAGDHTVGAVAVRPAGAAGEFLRVERWTEPDADGSHVEVTVYHLVGVRLVDARIEEDGDIHLVIRSKYPGEQMIVELPNVVCKGARMSKHKAELEQARSDFASSCGLDAWTTRRLRASPKKLVGTAAIVGVGFFDLEHPRPQSGVAPNNIELHPVLKFSPASCSG